jgi:hypothetical protein
VAQGESNNDAAVTNDLIVATRGICPRSAVGPFPEVLVQVVGGEARDSRGACHLGRPLLPVTVDLVPGSLRRHECSGGSKPEPPQLHRVGEHADAAGSGKSRESSVFSVRDQVRQPRVRDCGEGSRVAAGRPAVAWPSVLIVNSTAASSLIGLGVVIVRVRYGTRTQCGTLDTWHRELRRCGALVQVEQGP